MRFKYSCVDYKFNFINIISNLLGLKIVYNFFFFIVASLFSTCTARGLNQVGPKAI